MRRMAERGIAQAACSTTMELETACNAGIKDVLLAYPVVARTPRAFVKSRIVIATREFPCWLKIPRKWGVGKSQIGIFIDLNPGMNRTGVEQDHIAEILDIVRAIAAAGLNFAGFIITTATSTTKISLSASAKRIAATTD